MKIITLNTNRHDTMSNEDKYEEIPPLDHAASLAYGFRIRVGWREQVAEMPFDTMDHAYPPVGNAYIMAMEWAHGRAVTAHPRLTTIMNIALAAPRVTECVANLRELKRHHPDLMQYVYGSHILLRMVNAVPECLRVLMQDEPLVVFLEFAWHIIYRMHRSTAVVELAMTNFGWVCDYIWSQDQDCISLSRIKDFPSVYALLTEREQSRFADANMLHIMCDGSHNDNIVSILYSGCYTDTWLNINDTREPYAFTLIRKRRNLRCVFNYDEMYCNMNALHYILHIASLSHENERIPLQLLYKQFREFCPETPDYRGLSCADVIVTRHLIGFETDSQITRSYQERSELLLLNPADFGIRYEGGCEVMDMLCRNFYEPDNIVLGLLRGFDMARFHVTTIPLADRRGSREVGDFLVRLIQTRHIVNRYYVT